MQELLANLQAAGQQLQVCNFIRAEPRHMFFFSNFPEPLFLYNTPKAAYESNGGEFAHGMAAYESNDGICH